MLAQINEIHQQLLNEEMMMSNGNIIRLQWFRRLGLVSRGCGQL